jgi:hypothetical protein
MSVSCALPPPCNKLAPVSANFAVWWRRRSGAAVDWPFLLASAQDLLLFSPFMGVWAFNSRRSGVGLVPRLQALPMPAAALII